MVIINTTQTQTVVYKDLVFKYILEVHRLDCILGSTQDSTGKVHLFLIFNERDQIYSRNGRKETWERIENDDVCWQMP